jgi:hypothetical protein
LVLFVCVILFLFLFSHFDYSDDRTILGVFFVKLVIQFDKSRFLSLSFKFHEIIGRRFIGQRIQCIDNSHLCM